MADGSWGDEEWVHDDNVRVLAGEELDPWKTWDDCCGSWKFPAGLMSFIVSAGFKCPTPIQAYTWPSLMNQKDVIGVAKTGSGKTLGYLLPGYVRVKRQEAEGATTDARNGPLMLVLAPTRELCQQIFQESERFGNPAGIGTACVFGGAESQPQMRALRAGPQCVVATPGRLNDFLGRNVLFISQVSYLVLDEADRMLDMGFEPQVRDMIKYLPDKRQTAFFTATWPTDVKKVAMTLTSAPTHIQVGSSDAITTNKDITQHVKLIRNENEKMKFLEQEIFPKLQASNGSALVFTKTKKSASTLFYQLSKAGAPIVALHGDMAQRERDLSLWAFKEGKAKVMVATDVAQRGLDIKDVTFVVNYDPPGNLEDYTHRIGRTGRAGKKGDSYTLLYANEQDWARKIAGLIKKTGNQVPAELVEMLGGNGGGGYGGGGGQENSGWDNWKPGGKGGW